MRIITGEARGKKLIAPEGMHTRPTTDRVKEAIFNIIQFDIEGRRVLDLFAGSGQMGLEALSRGAESCLLVDSDRGAQQAILKNIKNCGFEGRCRLASKDAFSVLAAEAGGFGLIFLDPPYGGEILNRALGDICRFDILHQGGIIICESAKEDKITPLKEGYKILKEYGYGSIKVTTITRE